MRYAMSACAIAATLMLPGAAAAQTEIEFWHAFTGRLGELVAAQVEAFNESQDDYVVNAAYKGNYSETLNAGIAAFRAGEQPHILMVFEVGTATMMAAKGAIKPVYQVMEESDLEWNPDAYIGAVKGYYTDTQGNMLSLPFNSSTPVLWVNRDALEAAGIDPDTDLSTWQKVGEVLDKLKEAGHACPLTTAWQSWIHLENLSAYHNVPFATQENGFAGLDAELVFNGPVQVQHIGQLGEWAKEGKFVYTGRRNEGGANFRGGECALFTESSAGYAGIKAEADFDFDVRPLPYWEGVEGAPQNTIIGGASLWVMSGHEPEDYKGVAEFLNYPLLARGAGQMAPGHRLSADHHRGGRADAGAGLLRGEPGHRCRRQADDRARADAPFQGHPARHVRPDPDDHRRGARGGVGRRQGGAGGARHGRRAGQPAAAPLRAGQPLSPSAPRPGRGARLDTGAWTRGPAWKNASPSRASCCRSCWSCRRSR